MVKRILQIFALLLIVGAIIGYVGYKWIFSPNTNLSEPYELYIHSQTGFSDIQSILKDDAVLENYTAFEQVAKLMKYDKDEVPSGHYIIKPGWSNRQIISTLRAGIQSPINLTISVARDIHDIAGIVSDRIEPDSIELLSIFTDSAFLSNQGFTPETVIGMIIPDTYEMYWNTDAKSFFNKMKTEYDKYWKQGNRMALLEESGMTKNEVSTMASIVEKESNSKTERPIIAGVYRNRIDRGIPLQADPTVVFAVNDFTIRRVLKKHLTYDSPYNTYVYPGLPPGPICMPSKSSLDAVLNAEQHDYIFFCAKPGYNNEHLFAKTNAQHERNAAVYHRWLNEQKIMK